MGVPGGAAARFEPRTRASLHRILSVDSKGQEPRGRPSVPPRSAPTPSPVVIPRRMAPRTRFPCWRRLLSVKIWDTAGQEKYHSLAPMYYRGAGAAIVVYDITKMHSFRTLKEWINELRAQGPQDIAIAIAGNKRDLEAYRVSGRLTAPHPARTGFPMEASVFSRASGRRSGVRAEWLTRLRQPWPRCSLGLSVVWVGGLTSSESIAGNRLR